MMAWLSVIYFSLPSSTLLSFVHGDKGRGAHVYDNIYSLPLINVNKRGMHIVGIDEAGRGASKRRASPSLHVIGIDEAGRGALAGPVVVGVVAITKGYSINSSRLPRLRDSKKLTATQRLAWFDYIKTNPNIFYTSARQYQRAIDKNNITKSANIAASNALNRILERYPVSTTSILLDGSLYLYNKEHQSLPTRTIIRGDEKFVAIKLASIVAKVTRDSYMVRLHNRYPEYEFPRHKGYGTSLHRNMIVKYGPSDAHRLTYLKNWVE